MPDMQIMPEPTGVSILRIIQGVIGLFLLGFGYWIGHYQLDLIRSGSKAEGVIVDYREVYSHNSKGGMFFFAPIVEFHAGDHVVRFQNWSGNTSEGELHMKVPVLYNADKPETAMIDSRALNYIPWAPIMFVGAFLTLAGLFGKRFPGNAKV